MVALGLAFVLVAACGSRANQAQVVEALGNGGGAGTGRAAGGTGIVCGLTCYHNTPIAGHTVQDYFPL